MFVVLLDIYDKKECVHTKLLKMDMNANKYNTY